MYLCGGAVAGALAARNYDKIKEKAGPLLAAAGGAIGDAYTAAARRVGEKLEAMQDAMAENREANGAGAPGSSESAPHFSTANGTAS